MEKTSRKILSVALALVMVLCSLPFAGVTFSASAENSGYYTYTVENGEATITDCDTSISGDVVIPDTLGGYPVTSIYWGAFYGCTGLTSITIPDSVTSIGGEAFEGCTGLTSVTIPDSVTSIGNYAFSGCTGLTSISIPDSVTSIVEGAFYGCTGLRSITIPDSVKSIDDWAFDGCTGLTSVTIPNSVTSIGGEAFDGCTGLTSITIPDSVTSIGSGAFWDCTGLTSITIPDSVTSIGSRAFSGCTGLTSVTIPDSVTSIGWDAFSGCTSLTSITVSTGNTVYHSADNCLIETKSKTLISGCKNSVIPSDGSVTSIGNCAFEYCTGLTSITIPDSVTSIGECAFYRCAGLTSITIPDSVTSIGDWAFWGCTGLTSVTIPNSVTSIGEEAFCHCTGLTSLTIPDSVTFIGRSAFSGCSGLTSLTIPDSVTSIGSRAFSGCSGLTSITVSTGNTVYHSTDNCLIETESKTLILGCKNSIIPSDGSVTSIGYEAFYDCSGLTSITIPGSVTSIGDDAFLGCTGLTSITVSTGNTVYHSTDNCLIETESKTLILGCKNSVIPSDGSVTSIGGMAFYGCASLTSITIPDSVTSIGDCAFIGCTGLTSVTIGNSVTSIGDYAFAICTDLTSITIPDSVTDIGNKAFGYYEDESTFEVKKVENFTIYGYTGTAAETYANENGFSFVSHDNGHAFVDWLVTTEPTCTAEGEETSTCIICGESETRAIETRTHDLFHVEVASTCTVTGVSCDVCSLCGKIFNYSVLPLVEHTFGEWTVTAEPTCTAEGEETRTCSVCGEAETRTIEKAAHKIVIDTSVTPTCTKTGVTEGQHCSVCGEVLVEQQTIAAAGHNDNNSDGICDSCGENLGTHTPSENCSCSCHKKGIANFFFKILLFFQKLFKKNQVCKCGAWHY